MTKEKRKSTGVSRRTLGEQVYHKLKEEIILQQTPELMMGARINEVELAARLGCSTTPLREALNMLRRDNLIVSTAFHHSEVVSFTQKDIRDLLIMREELEISALRQALPKMTAEDLHILRSIQEEYIRVYEASNFTEVYDVNRRFHDHILTCADNRILTNMLDSISDQAALLRSPSMLETRQSHSASGAYPPILEHELLLQAIEAGDHEAACEAMGHHIRRIRDDVSAYYLRSET